MAVLQPSGRLTTTLLLTKLESGGRHGGPLEMADPQPFDKGGLDGCKGDEKWEGGEESLE